MPISLLRSFLMLLFATTFFSTFGCGGRNNTETTFNALAASQLEAFVNAYHTSEAVSLLSIISSNYSDVATVESPSIDERITFWSNRKTITKEAEYILRRFPVNDYELSLLGATSFDNSTNEVSFAINLYGRDAEFPAYNYTGRFFGTAALSRENNKWLIQKVRINRGALIILLDGVVYGGSNSPPKISLVVIIFSKVVVLGGTTTEYYWGRIPSPLGEIDTAVTPEVTGFGEPIFGGNNLHRLPCVAFGYNRPASGSYQVSVRIKTPANEIIPVNFNCLVDSDTIQIKK